MVARMGIISCDKRSRVCTFSFLTEKVIVDIVEECCCLSWLRYVDLIQSFISIGYLYLLFGRDWTISSKFINHSTLMGQYIDGTKYNSLKESTHMDFQ